MCSAGGGSHELREGKLSLRLVAIDRGTVLEADIFSRTGEQLRGEMRQMLAGVLHHGIDGRAADDEAAAGAGAFAERKEGGVTMPYAYLCGVHA